MLVLLACAHRDALVIRADDVSTGLLTEFVALLDDPRVVLGKGKGIPIDVYADLDCTECYDLSAEGGGWVVHGGAPLGVQYGLADVLEREGYGFFHPYATRLPDAFVVPDRMDAEHHEPAIRRRGLHLHTLHPIEALQALWMPNDTDEPARIVDWIVKNRGNHLQYPGLDDIVTNPGVQADWEAHSTAIVAGAHARGVTMGLGVQLFGTSNLQQAFDLLDDPSDAAANAAAIDERLAAISAPGWDQVSLSFGEFVGEDPQVFIDSVDLAYERIQTAMPGADVTATIHVGNFDDLRVTYQGEELLYYFLVKYANPGITPWIHSVMYYDLYEDAGGAYLHDEFDEHRAFLEERLAAGQPVGYHPETAYWIAFDNPVPQYLPLYLRTRSLDLEMLIPQGLDDHVVFSSGWEWGYWLNDAATLSMSYSAAGYEEEVRRRFEASVADSILALIDLQHEAHIEQRLSAYLAGRDAVIDIGDGAGIVSQPDRHTFEEVAAMSAADRAAFSAAVVEPLQVVGDGIWGLAFSSDDPWASEVADGIAVGARRAWFAAAANRAVLTWADGGDPLEEVLRMGVMLSEAAEVVAYRGAEFHDPDGERWARDAWGNPSRYDYGYLREAQTLCFWHREEVQVRNLVLGEENEVPGCIF